MAGSYRQHVDDVIDDISAIETDLLSVYAGYVFQHTAHNLIGVQSGQTHDATTHTNSDVSARSGEKTGHCMVIGLCGQ